MNIESEREKLSRLEARLAEASARETELAAEIQRLSYDAETGDGPAKKAQSRLNEEAFVVAKSIVSLGHAILESRRRVEQAEQAAIADENIEKAKRALAIATSIEARGKKLDEALLALAIEAELLENDLASLNSGLGISHPSIRNFKAIIERPFFAGLMFPCLSG
jgi:dynactin complex subunit